MKLHSISDIITNSSSEVFRYITSNTVPILKDFLQDILDAIKDGRTVEDLFEFKEDEETVEIFIKDREDHYSYLTKLPEFYSYNADYDW